jgi:hypothetical protein
MLPNSAPIPEAIFPAQINATITGPISLIIDMETIPGTIFCAPNDFKEGSDCKVNTNPSTKPVIAIIVKDL